MLPEKLRNALQSPKSTAQGAIALIAAVALAVFTGVTDKLDSAVLGELGGVLLLVVASIQRIFFTEDKPKEPS